MTRAASERAVVLIVTAFASAVVGCTVIGCTGSQAAIPIAAQRANCPSEKVVEVEKSTNVAILDVCGTVERWEWDPIEGYYYVGPVAPDGHTRAAESTPRNASVKPAVRPAPSTTPVQPSSAPEPAPSPP